jgi:biotin-dependent carboxylase-like uncharacterized protein
VIVVVEPGWGTTIQDRGRPGLAHLGVPTSGAVDPTLAAAVNRATGTSPAAAVIETAGGLLLEAQGPVTLATSVHTAPIALAAGDRLRVDADRDRAWVYVSARGGIDVPPVLGSRARDTLSGIGPLVGAGTVLGVGALVDGPPADVLALRPPHGPVRVWTGPRADWFTDAAVQLLVTATWSVGSEVSRVGARLDGPRIERRMHDELPSEGLVLGAVQVTPDGRPVVMLADHPTTGGYPVIGVVDPADVGRVAQARPGADLRFVAA